MRAREFLPEKADISTMKSSIIQQISDTDDEDIVQKVYTVINKSGLYNRIYPVLKRDTDTKSYIDELVNIIIDTPGTYEEKKAFINEYPNGYIDIERMLSGEYVTFDQLIVGSEAAPIDFVKRVFDSLKQVTFGTAKGPGEFALAVLSPHIKITGKGDLNIEDKVIEVKAAAKDSGGRVGTAGLLRVDNIPDILKRYLNIEFEPGQGLNLRQLSSTMKEAGLDALTQTELASKLFTYIFRGQADVTDLINAVVSGDDPNPHFLKANYQVYQEESGFTGMMLMNFPAQALKYFTDPLQMANEIRSFNVYLISSNPAHASRQILSQVTLRRVAEPTNAVPATAKKKVKANAPAKQQPKQQPQVQPQTQPQTPGQPIVPQGTQQQQATVQQQEV